MAYDSLGNLTDNGLWAHGAVDLTYDWASQPIGMVGSSITNTYTYDGNLKRIKTVQNGKTTYWVYSALTGTPIYSDETTDAQKTNYYSAGGAQFRLTNGNPKWTHLDHQGTPIAATWWNGNLAWREHYTPFGEKTTSSSYNDNDIGYTGHVQDDASGLTYMQARYYDPVLGRFLSPDPLGYTAGMGLYTYVFNDPVNGTDPDGLDCEYWGTCPPGSGAFAAIDSINCGDARTCSDGEQTRIRNHVGVVPIAGNWQATAASMRAQGELLSTAIGAGKLGKIGVSAYLARNAHRGFAQASSHIINTTTFIGRTGGRSGRKTLEYAGSGGARGADKLFNQLTRGKSTLTKDGQGRVGSLGDGSIAQISRNSTTGVTSVRISQQTTRTGSRVKREKRIKVRFKEKSE
ncbi:MAG: hypothetical protein JJ919_15245 [Henriciella sp.]|nr:hypothetical protein [Henriciella sp.]